MQRHPREAALALRDATPEEAELVLAELEQIELALLAATWQLHAHDYQLRPQSTPIWVLNGGRGSGKTRALSERRLDRAEDHGSRLRGLLAGKTIGDVRDVMLEGESGMIACAERRGYKIDYVANRKLVKHPSGAQWLVMSSEAPDDARGKQSNDIWGDEFSSWKRAVDFFDNLMLGHRLRLGPKCEADFSSTPKPNPITRRLLKDPRWAKRVKITSGTSHANFDNLDESYRELLLSVYEGTKLGQQELYGLLLDMLGAVVEQATIDRYRQAEPYEEIVRRVVSLDPAATSKEESDDSGIVVVGADAQLYPHAYVLEDCTLSAAPPKEVAERVVRAFIEHDCEAVVYESNNGGEWIEAAIRAAADAARVEVPIVSVWAEKSKRTRFEPVGALYEKGRVHHVGTLMVADPIDGALRGAAFADLEKEATTWIPGEPSPNRLDALAQAVSHLLLGEDQVGPLSGYL